MDGFLLKKAHDFYPPSVYHNQNIALMNRFISVTVLREEKKSNSKPTKKPLSIELEIYYFLALNEDYKYGFHVSCTDIVSTMF